MVIRRVMLFIKVGNNEERSKSRFMWLHSALSPLECLTYSFNLVSFLK